MKDTRMNKQFSTLSHLFRDKRARLQAIVGLLVLLVGLILSIAGFLELQDIASERLYLQAQKHTQSQVKQIQTNLDISLDSLTEIGVLFHVLGDVSRSQLASYVDSDTKYHSGTVALGWVPKISGEDVKAFEKDVQQSDPNFHVYEITGHGVPTSVTTHEAVYPIKFLISPEDRNIKAGLNLASIGSRVRLMNKAERMEKTVISQRISLYYGSERFYGFQALHPVFKSNKLGKKELAGFVMGNYDIESLVEDVFSNDNVLVDIALYDANTTNQQVLYSSTTLLNTVDKVKQQKRQSWTYSLNVADQQWIMEVFPNTALLSGTESWLPSAGLIIGSLMTLLLTLYLFIALIKTRQVSQLSTVLEGTTTQLDIQTKLKQDADKANLAKSGLLRAASHDLRQPLHTIGLLTTLLKDSDDKAEQAKLIDKTQIAVDGMNTMFGSLLDLSLLESGELPVNPEHFYLQDVLEKLALDFELQAKHHALSFKVVETSACVYTDPLLLERILRNLLSNAIRYTPQGKVLLGCRRLKNLIRVCVIDTGIGLDNESKYKIFDAFYRDKAAQQLSDKGLGLGLSIVQEIANLLRLNLGVNSQRAKGACFYVDIPLGNATLIGETQLIQQQASVNKLIWVIEDDATTRYAMEKLLQSWQCQVATMASSKEVLLTLKQHRTAPDVIIADYQLINETGLELALQIQKHFQQAIPIIIITGTSDLKIREAIERQGCQFMMKPVKPEGLNSRLLQL
jgi:signal transduction histidine kinase/CheY-like chemotaxis protein